MTTETHSFSLTSRKSHSLRGETTVPGDKSISHRALILGSLAVGPTRISGLLESADIHSTIGALKQFGAEIERHDDGHWSVHGVGTGGYADPTDVIDCGNSGTSVRLLLGAMATTPITAVFTGDHSLRGRPMRRVTEPLTAFGTQFSGRADGLLPITATGTADPVPVTYRLTTPSAQTASAILLAGLNAPGPTRVIESARTRDHTVRMLRAFGARLDVEECHDGRHLVVTGYAELQPQSIHVPGDPSAAAFLIAAALMTENSDICLRNVGMNSTRTGFLTTVNEMGAKLRINETGKQGGEPIADIRVQHQPLRGIDVPPERAPSMIDEYPILAALAACAEGETVMHGIGELRVKESDRIDAMARGLESCGVSIRETENSLSVTGCGYDGIKGGGICETRLDHRIAMSFLCLGLAAHNPITIDDARPIATSFPDFVELLSSLGGCLGDRDRE